MNAQKEKSGLSLKTTSICMMIISLLITIVLLFTGIGTFRSFRDMEQSTDDYILLSEAAAELMSASDYLTEEVQCYTVIGNRMHMENYFTEVEVTRRRENALAVMEEKLPDSSALKELKEGMSESVSLMDREYYAMRLMMEAQGDTDLPEALQKVVLSKEDSELSPEQKTLLAQRLVHDSAYDEQKSRIRQNMSQCVDDLKNDTHGTQQKMKEQAYSNLIRMAVMILIQTLAIALMMWLTTHLGVNPVLRAVDHIRKDQKIPIVGAAEFRYLAGTYNMMYNSYKKSIEKLNFKASHDELTGAYNRAGYDLILSSLDMDSTAMLLFDADVFKGINDQFGHETGDKILQKITAVLQHNFRSDDYVCRIGGDEFVVLMVHIHQGSETLVRNKVSRINQALSDVTDGLPPVSLSAGVAYGEDQDPEELFRQADAALYYVKEHGKNSCCFYSEIAAGEIGQSC